MKCGTGHALLDRHESPQRHPSKAACRISQTKPERKYRKIRDSRYCLALASLDTCTNELSAAHGLKRNLKPGRRKHQKLGLRKHLKPDCTCGSIAKG